MVGHDGRTFLSIVVASSFYCNAVTKGNEKETARLLEEIAANSIDVALATEC